MNDIRKGRVTLRLDKKTKEVLQKYNSTKEASLWLYNYNGYKCSSSITACCRGKRKTISGFKWSYEPIVNLEGEIWKPISSKHIGDREGFFISNKKGRIRDQYSLRNHVLGGGYYSIRFGKGKRNYLVNVLVALTFHPNPNNKPQVDHLDENKLNNDADNLEWVTAKENTERALGKQIIQYDLNGNKIGEFISIIRAMESLGKTNPSIIHKVLRNERPTAFGYKWKYKD